jgi:hypothetical protein
MEPTNPVTAPTESPPAETAAAPAAAATGNEGAAPQTEDSGFWGWWGGVKQTVAPKLTQVANVLDEVGTNVRSYVFKRIGIDEKMLLNLLGALISRRGGNRARFLRFSVWNSKSNRAA